MNKSIFYTLFVLVFMQVSFCACSSDDSYAKLKEREERNINSFISSGVCVVDPYMKDTTLYVAPIKVISMSQFLANDSTTDVSKNEYVLINSSGVYMQIISKGNGQKLGDGETATILGRHIEYNLASDSVQCTNLNNAYETVPDVFTCTNTSGTFTASFLSGLMYSRYGSTVVPSGWLSALPYVKLGRQTGEKDAVAKVRLIVPSTAGQSDMLSNVYACFYELTFTKSR